MCVKFCLFLTVYKTETFQHGSEETFILLSVILYRPSCTPGVQQTFELTFELSQFAVNRSLEVKIGGAKSVVTATPLEQVGSPAVAWSHR